MRRWIGAGLVGAALGASLAWALAGDPHDALAEAPGSLSAAPSAPKEGWPPDPPPVASNTQWVFEIQSKQSVPSISKVTQLTLDKAEPTPRMMGRFALEFYVGRELLDRLRFNVPLNGDGAREGGPGKKRPVFRVNTKFFARMADQKRATYLRLVDRATGEIQLFTWPPDKNGKLAPYGADAAARDAGTSDAGSADAGSTDGGDAGRFTPVKP